MTISKRTVVLCIASGFGIGLSPFTPGTLGSLMGVPLALFINRVAGNHPTVAVAGLIGFTMFAIWLAQKAGEILRAKDPQVIVIDEIAGFGVAAFLTNSIPGLVLAFVLFRFFDIAKIFPASRLEQLPGGAGIVLDDIMAGFYTFLILRLCTYAGVI